MIWSSSETHLLLFPPPVITITTPPPQVADYTTQPLQLTGTYSGTQLLSNMQVDFTSLDTAAGQPTTRTSLLPLSQTTGSNIPYSSLLDNAGQLPIGHYSITATIKDPFAQGQATTNFSNFPPALSGLEGTLGPFRFALPAGNCQIVFYQTADRGRGEMANGQQPHHLGNAGLPHFGCRLGLRARMDRAGLRARVHIRPPFRSRGLDAHRAD